MAHVLVSAAHKSSGKTTVTLGLCAALHGRGLAVQPFKKGPDYIDPMWLARAAARQCHNLDFHTQSRNEILTTFGRHMRGADIGLIEGNKGLYDGLDLEGGNSNAALARLLGAPVVLVLDARGMTRGVAPLILGYQHFEPDIRIAGVILNKVGGSRHEAKLRAIIEHYTNVPVVGAIHHDAGLIIDERHLGLIPSNESGRAEEQIRHIADRLAGQVELDRVVEIAEQATLAPAPPTPDAQYPDPDVRIGIARDSAFGFYYPGDLDALRAAGAQLVEFNTLRDSELPAVDGLFIGGGFPETHMQQLESNTRLREAIYQAIERGMPTYAECGGLMYLARTLRWGERVCNMVGVIPGDITMHEKPQGRGYTRLRETTATPWPIGSADDIHAEIDAHEFHYSSLDNLPSDAQFAYEVLRGAGIDGHHDGLIYKNLLANYVHFRDVENNHWAHRFIHFVRRARRQTRLNEACGS